MPENTADTAAGGGGRGDGPAPAQGPCEDRPAEPRPTEDPRVNEIARRQLEQQAGIT